MEKYYLILMELSEHPMRLKGAELHDCYFYPFKSIDTSRTFAGNIFFFVVQRYFVTNPIDLNFKTRKHFQHEIIKKREKNH